MTPGISQELNDSISFVATNTWRGVPAITITEAGVAPAVDAASVLMHFRTLPTAPNVVKTLSSADGTITITSANGWTFAIPKQTLNLAPGKYYWDFRVTDVAGDITTYLSGLLEVLQPVTHTP